MEASSALLSVPSNETAPAAPLSTTPENPAVPAEDGDEEAEAETPEAPSDEEDFQLQRALDLLKTWDIFHRIKSPQTAKAGVTD